MALAHLLHRWVKDHSGTLVAFTIDHQLRPEAAQEAQHVSAWCGAHNMPHVILTWDKKNHPPHITHEEARAARHQLLRQACSKKNIRHLFLAHHADDQAETYLIRLAKNSGPDGLAAMPVTRDDNGIMLCRPLLPLRKYVLEDYCAAHNIPFIRDPSNHSEKFLRGQLRTAYQLLDKTNQETGALYEKARQAGMARAAADIETNAWLKSHAQASPYGFITFQTSAWRNAAPALHERSLTRALLCMSSADYPPRSKALTHLIKKLLNNKESLHTLSGCFIEDNDTHITIAREDRAIDDERVFHDGMVWDERFMVMVNHSAHHANPFLGEDDAEIYIKKLGPHSRAALETMGAPAVAALPATIRKTLPALYKDNNLFVIPTFTTGQAPVNAVFSPRRGLIASPFHVAPPLISC